MRTGVLGAVGVQAQGVIGYHKALRQGHVVLPFFNFRIVKLFNFAAI